MKSKRRETIYLPADVAEALRRASLAAGGYGEKTRIAAESIRAHPEVRAQLEKIREERIMTMARMRWTDLQLLDTDGRTPLRVDGATRRRKLDEFRRTGGMHGAFFAPLGLPHEDPEDASTWGPASPDDVDWEGFHADD